MPYSVGIGIITYNRKDIVNETIDRVRAFTRQPNAALVVADDGSSDGTLAMLRDKQVPVVTGVNMGDPWNKNRALFLLSHLLGCDTVILLEDDTSPNTPGWEADWIKAAQRWGHMNFAGDWMSQYFRSGAGTVEDPIRSEMVTAQCAAFSREALTYGGYFDARFRGYGHAHVEHSARLIRVGFGGAVPEPGSTSQTQFYMIKNDLRVVACQSYFNETEERRNVGVAQQIMGEQGFRAPWRDDSQMRQFRSEVESAMDDGGERFRLTPASPGALTGAAGARSARRGLFSRLLHRG